MLDLRNSQGIVLPVPSVVHYGSAPHKFLSAPGLMAVEPELPGMRASLQIGHSSSLLVGDGQSAPFLRYLPQNFNRMSSHALDGTLLDGIVVHRPYGFAPACFFVAWGCLFNCWQDVRDRSEGVRFTLAAKAVRALHDELPASKLSLRLVDRRAASEGNLGLLSSRGFTGAVIKYLPARLNPCERDTAHWRAVRFVSRPREISAEEPLQCSA